MKQIKIIFLSLLFSGLGISFSAQSMFKKACKGINYTLSGASFLSAFYSDYYSNSKIIELEDVDPVVLQFSQEQFKAINIKNPEDIDVKRGKKVVLNFSDENSSLLSHIVTSFRNNKENKLNTFSAVRGKVIIPHEYCDLLLLAKELKNKKFISSSNVNYSEEECHKIAGVIQHEAVHIKHNDSSNALICAAVIPFAMHPIFKASGLIMQKIYKFNPAKSNIEILRRNIGVGFLKNKINENLLMAYYRFFEQRADDEVVNIEGLQKFLKEHEAKELNMMIEANVSLEDSPVLQKLYPFVLSLNQDKYHPKLSTRIQRLEDRIKADSSKEN